MVVSGVFEIQQWSPQMTSRDCMMCAGVTLLPETKYITEEGKI